MWWLFAKNLLGSFPDLVFLLRERDAVPKPFRFQQMWGFHETFILSVQEVWNERMEGCAMMRISRKLKIEEGFEKMEC